MMPYIPCMMWEFRCTITCHFPSDTFSTFHVSSPMDNIGKSETTISGEGADHNPSRIMETSTGLMCMVIRIETTIVRQSLGVMVTGYGIGMVDFIVMVGRH